MLQIEGEVVLRKALGTERADWLLSITCPSQAEVLFYCCLPKPHKTIVEFSTIKSKLFIDPGSAEPDRGNNEGKTAPK